MRRYAFVGTGSRARMYLGAAGFADGEASVLVGITGNESLRTAQAVRVEELVAR